MYKVFINDKPFILTNNYPSASSDKGNWYSIQNKKDLLFAIEIVEKKNQIQQVNVHNENIEWLWETFKEQFLCIEAAGGVVKNKNEDILFIFRNGKWDLPKGKIEQGEDVIEAAIREVKEESGITQLSVIRNLISTYHTYKVNNRKVLKHTVWIEMFSGKKEVGKPQKEEGITEVKWFSKNNLNDVLNNTYSSIKEIISHNSI